MDKLRNAGQNKSGGKLNKKKKTNKKTIKDSRLLGCYLHFEAP